ncbi:GGDEF domain-containing protein [Paenibacillus luteus]|nr:GGDEF domain-containing protein [Paenibacillus luteus]
MGGAVWPDHDRDILAVVKLADEALYASKNNGKNRAIFIMRSKIRCKQ